MKNGMVGSLAALLMMLFTTSSYADVRQVWTCKLNDGKTGADLVKVSSSWLKAAKTMDGGKDLEVRLNFPLAASVGDGGFTFVLIAADAKTWGIFYTNYVDSPAAKADVEWGAVASCSSSALWNSVKMG
jgi:hypothetical protein